MWNLLKRLVNVVILRIQIAFEDYVLGPMIVIPQQVESGNHGGFAFEYGTFRLVFSRLRFFKNAGSVMLGYRIVDIPTYFVTHRDLLLYTMRTSVIAPINDQFFEHTATFHQWVDDQAEMLSTNAFLRAANARSLRLNTQYRKMFP